MYKSELHNLCQKKAWPRPDFSISRTGPDHDLRFHAAVTVNGLKFDDVDLSKSSKEALNKVSQAALKHFASTSTPPEYSPPTIAAESELSYNSELQTYAQKNLLPLALYTYVCEMIDHALCFKAQVIVDGRTFHSRMFFKTLEEAKNDAAKTALMLLPSKETNNAQDYPVSYMNLLNELAQKAGMKMPIYKTGSNGASDMPIYCSIVDVGNCSFFGEVAECIKQAELNAAKVAWLKLEEDNKGKNEITVQNDSGLSASFLKNQQDTTEQNKFIGNDTSSSALLPAQQTADTSPQLISACHVRPANSLLLYNRVMVFPRKVGMVLPENSTLLPFSDDKWVAVSLNSPSFEDVEMIDGGDGRSKLLLKPTGGVGKRKKKQQSKKGRYRVQKGKKGRKHV